MKRSNKVTAEMVMEIKAMLASNLYYQHQIAARFGINQGRVSEVKNGFFG